MRRRSSNPVIVALTCACVALNACTPAQAAVLDPADDVHCSVISFYFYGLAKHVKAPAHQQHATKVVFEWYAARIRTIAAEEGYGTEEIMRRTAPILEMVKADPLGSRDELASCSERAIKNGKFNSFAASMAD